MATFDVLPAREREQILRSRRRVLEGAVALHRSSTATPEIAELRTGDLHLTVLEDVLVDVYHGFALTRGGRILEDTAITRSAVERKLRNGKLLRPTRTVTLDRPVMNLECGPKNSNFFHFWFESLTKLLWVHEPEISDLGPAYLLYSRDLPPWKEVLLHEALPPQITPLQIDRGTRVAASVFVDLPPYRGTALGPDALGSLRRWAEPLRRSADPGVGASRIAISRRQAQHRRILNEEAFSAALEERGFVMVALEDLSVAEQIAVFHRADIIIGQHGAGLTHLLHSRPGTKVLEIMAGRPESVIDLYRGVAVATGLEYSNLFCGAEGQHIDAQVPVDQVIAWVDAVTATT